MHRTSNPFAYRAPITLDTLDQLFAHHAGISGGWSMTSTPPEPTPPPAPAAPAPATYVPPATQDDLNRLVGERLAREREKYADYEDLKKKAAEHDAAVEAARSDHEKAVEAARKDGESAATKAADARVVRAEAKAAAATAKFRDPDVAVRLLDLTGISVADNGDVDAAALKTKLDELAAAHPYLLGDGRPAPVAPPRPDPSQGGGGGGDEKPGSIAEARRVAREAREAKTRPKTA